MPRQLTENDVERLVEMLVLAPETDPCRRFLEGRKLWSSEVISELEVGCLGSRLVFVQRDEAGRLLPRYRTYDVLAPKERRWMWSPGEGPTLGYWPWRPAPKDFEVWVFEGEWDVWTAIGRLGFTAASLHAITFTSGASVPVPAGAVPTWLRGRPVNLCYDNDVYQGPTWKDHRAPSDGALAGMRQRRGAFLRTANSMERQGCEVILRAVPVDPLEMWGGDLRDWTDQGGRDVASIPASSLEAARAGEITVVDRDTIDSVVLDVGLTIRVRCSVQTVEEDGVVVPIVGELDCDMGTKSCCGECRAPILAPEKVVDYGEVPDVLAEALTSGNFERHVLKRYLGQPGRCSIARLRHITYKAMCRWTAASSQDGAREVTVLSEMPPNLSGETEVEGTVHHGADGQVVIMAKSIRHVDQQRPDVRTHAKALRAIGSPAERPTADQIAMHLEERAKRLSKVTRIYGRDRLHQALDLLYHSALWFHRDGQRQRAWLDVAIVGDTGSGKSTAAQRLSAWWQLGTVHLCMENVSRAGLTMGAVKDRNGNFRTRPGLLPRNNGKLLILDEFHVMVEDGWNRGESSPLLHLQTARDVGFVEGVKVYGARRLSAAVRLATISNWFGGRASTRKFPCEHFGMLYGRPEILRRLDIGVAVSGEPDLTPPVCDEPPTEAYRLLVQRAWSLQDTDVVVEDTAVMRAEVIAENWRERYCEDLPLYTYADKPNGLLRLAIAAANLCFTTPARQPEKCLVTPEHVEWAGRWLEQLWAETGYEELSVAEKQKSQLVRPFHVEHHLTSGIGLFDPSDALQTLDRLFTPATKNELMTLLMMQPPETEKWCSEMVRLGALESVQARNTYHREWRLTRGANQVLKNLVRMATDAPDKYSERATKLHQWMQFHAKDRNEDPTMLSLALPEEAVRSLWNG